MPTRRHLRQMTELVQPVEPAPSFGVEAGELAWRVAYRVTESLRRCRPRPRRRAAGACLRAAVPAAEAAFSHVAGDLRGDRGFVAADRAGARPQCRGQS